MSHQRTLQTIATCKGIGIHSGQSVTMSLRPAPANSGVVFKRIDLPSAPTIEAKPAHIVDVHHATTIGKDGMKVRTIEHLMAAFAGTGLDNVLVELDGEEVPAMDGSAAPFVELIRKVGLKRQMVARTYLKIKERLVVETERSSIQIVPSKRLQVIYTMRFDHPLLGEQSAAFDITREMFAREIASCRTYGFLKDIEELRRRNLGLGGSFDNAIVIGEGGVVNGDLRFRDELVRHKVLDLLGDLYLLGRPILGTVIAHGAGHFLHTRLVREIQRHLDLEHPASVCSGVIERWARPLLQPERSLEVVPS
ncbi:UDP-3-O-acyl-N-acetylglucosamine deacetylase [Candidatus Methylomirabilis sp.]|uniref:UDP-3-O-acyl-N-acetylglucosamine deacetylase n=1 Tax=Candidatus Methylomirabilis sp. TaxID=2032687 RepID=UPI0030763447